MEFRNVQEDAAGHFELKCAWCRQVIGESNVKDSHGMCAGCYRRELEMQRPHVRQPSAARFGGSIGLGGEQV